MLNEIETISSAETGSTVESSASMLELPTTRERLALYLAAEKRVLLGQSYTIGNRQLTRANLAEIRKAITALKEEIALEEGTSRGFSKRIVFCD